MSQENVEIVQAAFDAEGRHDPAVLEFYDPSVTMEFSDSPFADFIPWGRCHGLGEVQRAFRDFYEAFDNVTSDIEELLDAGENVISVFTYRGTGRTSGVETKWGHMAGVWTLRDGKIVRVRWLRTREQALEAAGLSG